MMNKISLMKSFRSFCIILFCTGLMTSCQTKEKLLGNWMREGDSLAGMKIKVVKEGESFKAIIIATNDSCELSGFVAGDIKWKNIRKNTDNKYEFEDLMKSPIAFSDKFEPSYDLSNLELVSENEIQTRAFSKGAELVGTQQKWKRIIDSPQ